MKFRRIAFAIALGLFLPSLVLGQNFGRTEAAARVVVPGEAWGTAQRSAVTIGSSGFSAHSDTQAWSIDGNGYRNFTETGLVSTSTLSLPTGAIIQRVELVACDESTVGQLFFYVWFPADDGNWSTTDYMTTGTTEAAGCAVFGGDLAAPHVVNARTETAVPVVWDEDGNSATRFLAFRVFYRLQVSPAPVSATFADVPTGHPFFKFVEALSAAGITGGCGGGNYCPNSAVTRGQMAVFLASALGLHWPD